MTGPAAYHLVGVAGVGMSALARVLLAGGNTVSGSDRAVDSGDDAPVVGALTACGLQLRPQDGSGVTAHTGAVVLSTAIEPDNPDLAAAEARGIPVRHRAEVLAGLAAERSCVAVSGTSGKSTVTGMLGWALQQLGADPTVVVGAAVLDWRSAREPGSVLAGGSDLWVVKADESDRSLLHFRPDWALITNASADHFGLADTHALFDRFAARARCGVIDGRTDPSLAALNAELTVEGSRFGYGGAEFEVRLPGRHNAANAFCAALACERLGFAPGAISNALRGFRGLARRLEVVGVARGVTVIDDYAHNPAKIRAAWEAVAPRCERVHAVWRPHGYGPLAKMMDGLCGTFASLLRPQDRLFLLPVYDAGGTADRSCGSDMLRGRLSAAGDRARCVAGPDEAVERVAATAGRGDTVLVMGARDPGLPALARSVLERLSADH